MTLAKKFKDGKCEIIFTAEANKSLSVIRMDADIAAFKMYDFDFENYENEGQVCIYRISLYIALLFRDIYLALEFRKKVKIE
jgi:hypothetical protein